MKKNTGKRSLQKMIRRIVLVLIVLVNLTAAAYIIKCRGEYTMYFRDPANTITDCDVSFSQDGVIELAEKGWDGDYYFIRFKGVCRGETDSYVTILRGEDEQTYLDVMSVDRIGRVIRGNGFDYNGWQILGLTISVSMFLVSILLLAEFIARIRKDLYSYKTLQIGGLAILISGLTILNVAITVYILPRYRMYRAGTLDVFFQSGFALFLMAAIPFIVVFAAALSVSNLRLIRKEGFRTVNVLGIGISVSILSGAFFLFVLPNLILPAVVLPSILYRVQYVVLALFCFFLSFLLSTMICGLISAKRVPAFDQDYIIILGCGIRRDGTLMPLLQGRVDRAVWFWKRQYEVTGKRAVLVPSGGKGTDEIISEGEAMRRYLVSQGIPEEYILPETRSTTTLENMKFSKALIEERSKGAKVIYSTTNYHVFRSGILAGKAGLRALGIGSRTRWYFWPNAFVREFFGVVVSSWRLEILLFGGVAAVAAILAAIF